jgi:hypothetical protein
MNAEGLNDILEIVIIIAKLLNFFIFHFYQSEKNKINSSLLNVKFQMIIL